MRWTAVVNPVAGRGRTLRLLPRLRSELARRGVAIHLAATAADGVRAAQEALARGEGIVACGGDGTVAELAGVAAAGGAPLAVVPTGAGNDFARQLGLDLRRPLGALELLESGCLVDVDLGRVASADGASRTFTTIANVGFDAEANRWANQIDWARGSALYLTAIARTVVRYRPQPLVVRVDEDEWRGKAWLVAIGNTRWYAGGLKITPDAELDDGLLDVCVITAAPVHRFVTRFPTVMRGTHPQLDDVLMLRGREVEVQADVGAIALDVWASGEPVGPLTAHATVEPKVLRVLVPGSAAQRGIRSSAT